MFASKIKFFFNIDVWISLNFNFDDCLTKPKGKEFLLHPAYLVNCISIATELESILYAEFQCEAYVDMQHNYRLLVTRQDFAETEQYACWV